MRWVLNFKETGKPSTVKGKARLVVLGFTDPDVVLVNVRSPTLTRRVMAMATHKQADAKTAFLQGGASQQQQGIYGMPVKGRKRQ